MIVRVKRYGSAKTETEPPPEEPSSGSDDFIGEWVGKNSQVSISQQGGGYLVTMKGDPKQGQGPRTYKAQAQGGKLRFESDEWGGAMHLTWVLSVSGNSLTIQINATSARAAPASRTEVFQRRQ